MTTENQPLAKPLPCPFCGSNEGLSFDDGSTYRWGVASCIGCGATAGEVRRSYQSGDAWHADAIREWNLRAQIPAPEGALREAAQQALHAMTDFLQWRKLPLTVVAARASALRAALAAQPAPVALTDEQAEALIDEISYWSAYVVEDTAPTTLEKHIRSVFVAHGITQTKEPTNGR